LNSFLQVGKHALADAGDLEDPLGLGDEIGDSLGKILDGLPALR